jgi:hypothetical protein
MPTGATFLQPAYDESSEASLAASIAAAAEAARQADYAVVYAGINKSAPEHQWGNAPDTEGNDRLNIDFPGEQLRLIKAVSEAAGAKTVVVLNGSVYEVVDWIDGVGAALATFYPGQNGATATADILTGKVSPSGKLPFTWPKRYTDTVGYVPGEGSQEALKSDDVFYSEGIFEGYRYYDLLAHDSDTANDVEPQFAFGHGLSYGEYSWSGVSLSRSSMDAGGSITASVTLTNTNGVAGKQVVQLYIQDPASSVARPWKELKDFDKKSIAANGSATYTFDITKDHLSFWDEDTHSQKAEAGQFNILVGDASDSIRASASFTLTGDSAPDPSYTVVQAENFVSQTGASTGDVEEVDGAVMGRAPNRYIEAGAGGAAASWNLKVPEAGKYSLIFRYANGAFGGSASGYTAQHDKPAELLVNGEGYGSYDFQNTRHGNVWNYDSVDVALAAGDNTVALNIGEGSAGLRLDKLIAQRVAQRWQDPVPSTDTGGGVPPTGGAEFEAENASMLNNATVRGDVAGASGEAYVKLEGAGASAAIPIYAPTSVKFRLQVAYSNGSGSAAPCEVYVNGARKGTLTFGPTGGDGDWKFEQTDEITLLTGSNTVLLESALGSVNIDRIDVIGGMGYLDAEPPVVNGTKPAGGGALLGGIFVYYSETVRDGGSGGALGGGSGGSPSGVSITDGESGVGCSYAVSGATLAISPDRSQLRAGAEYTVTVAAGAVVDAMAANPLAEPYVFTFVAPAPNYGDPAIRYMGEWTESGGAMRAGAGASLDFWYYGDQAVLLCASGGATVNVWVDDYLDASPAAPDGAGEAAVFFDTGALSYGLHYIKVDVTSGTFGFAGASVNKTLLGQPLPKDGWTVSGVRDSYPSSDPLSAIVDGNRGTRWASGAAQSSSGRDWFAIDFKQAREINALLLVCRRSNVGSDIQDYTRAYELFVSDDGEEWKGPLAAGAGSPMFTGILFPTQSARYVKVVQTGDAPGDWWSVYEAYAFRAPDELIPAPAPPGMPTGLSATGLNQQIKLAWNAARGAARYQVFRDGAPAGYSGEAGYVDILGADGGAAHTYTVRALDGTGLQSPPSLPASASVSPEATDIPRAGWAASASHTHSSVTPAEGVDSSLDTRWITGVGIAPGMWYAVDMGLTYRFNAITHTSNATDYPSAFDLEISRDGMAWEKILSGAGGPNATNVVLAEAAEARYVRISNTGAARGDWWSIFDLNIAMLSDLDRPQRLSAAGYNGFIRLDWHAPAGQVFEAHHYDVYRDGELYRGDVADTRFVDSDVAPNRAYEYEVAAVAPDGTSSPKSSMAGAKCDASRTQLPKNNWSASASAGIGGYGPELAVDSIDSVSGGRTKWTTGAPQDGGQTFTLYLNDAYPVDTLRISSDNDYGREYSVSARVGGEWVQLLSGVAGSYGAQDLSFGKVRADAFTISETGTASAWWAIYELYAFNSAAPDPAWSIDGLRTGVSGVTVSVSRGGADGALAVLASYAPDGRMLRAEYRDVTADGGYTFAAPPAGAAGVKAFLLDRRSFAPLCAAFGRQL